MRLLEDLEKLHRHLAELHTQPLMQFSEGVVMQWLRAIDGPELVQPRLIKSGHIPHAFFFGIEPREENRLESCRVKGGIAGFNSALNQRLDSLKERLTDYFGQSGYRSSSDSCDNLMVELTRFSRFLSTCLFDEEIRTRQLGSGSDDGTSEQSWSLYETPRNPPLLWALRRAHCFWEPYLNQIICAWEGNTLEGFDQALKNLAEALEMSPAEQQEHFPQPGFPIRPLHGARLKVVVQQPEHRAMRSRSVFWVRYNQLLDRLESEEEVSEERLHAISRDVEHYLDMVESNTFMMAYELGFLTQARAGVSTIRGRPAGHMFLQDPQDFFKKAVLFHNGTYTVEGGGVDRMFLQLRLLERYFKFDNWNGNLAKTLKPMLAGCVVAWEENRWKDFTGGLLALATYLRDTDER